MKQTAISWLGHELNTKLFYDISEEKWNEINEIFIEALKMETQQIIEAWENGAESEYQYHINNITRSDSHIYFADNYII